MGVGVNRSGAFAQYLVIPQDNVVKVDKEIPEDIIACFDPFGNAVHSALKFNLIGEDVLITGAGPIGIMAAMVCRHVGARHIVITDLNDYRLSLAEKLCKSIHTVNVANQTIESTMKELGMKEGFDVGLEMSGSEAALNSIVNTMDNGGKIAVLGLHGGKTAINWDNIVFKGLTICGIYGREMFETWYKMSAMLRSGLDISGIITHRFDCRDFEDAFAVMNSGESGKVVLDWTALD